VPAVGNVRENDPPGARFAFQRLVSDVVVCAAVSELDQVTLPPAGIVTCTGVNWGTWLPP
jgi:hypothetical protein